MQQPYKFLRMIEKRLAVPLVGACMYEAFALTFHSERMPPITKLAHQHKWLFPALCGLAGVHIWFYEPSPCEPLSADG
jgi:hypothetical protein